MKDKKHMIRVKTNVRAGAREDTRWWLHETYKPGASGRGVESGLL